MLPIAAITTTGKVVLLLVAGTFIAYALITSLVLPKRHPGFPGAHLGAFLGVSALLFAAQIGAVVWVTGTQEVEEAETSHEAGAGEESTPPEEAVPEETAPAETETTPSETEEEQPTTGETETEPAETEQETTTEETEPSETTPAGPAGDAAAGKAVFTANCAGCHTLADAGTSGSVGPNLDDAKPSADHVVERVTEGKGAMPSFSGTLTEQQIADVAAYVSSVAGS